MMIVRFLFLVLCFTSVRAADPAFTLRVGAGRADITPEPAVLNWVTGKPYGKVLDPLNVHALVLDDGRSKAVLIRWDLVDVSESARDEVRRVVGTALRIPPENIFVHASHTHSAPWAPVYHGGRRGKEHDTWWALRHMPSQNSFPPFIRWMNRLLAGSVEAARRAAATTRPASMAIGRIAVDEYLQNRRPRAAAKGPAAVPGVATPGPVDPTLTLVTFRDSENILIVALFAMGCHAVSIYPTNPAISADWPGAAAKEIAAALGGESMFLQGTSGDINPWRRGEAAVAEMAAGLAQKARLATRSSVRLAPGPLQVVQTSVDLPLTPAAKARLGQDTVAAEIQILVCGPLAIVGLPGEPMTELGMAIRAASPFPQTLVLGYSNGNGAHYVGMPGEKARGGYEAGAAGAGTDECGTILVEAASRLLREAFGKTRGATKP